jgi:peptidoglycan LD-endopeptidase CwlK
MTPDPIQEPTDQRNPATPAVESTRLSPPVDAADPSSSSSPPVVNDHVSHSDRLPRVKDLAIAISSILSAIAIPVVGYWVSSALKNKEIEGKFVELAVEILKSEPTANQKNLREWATDIINNYSGVRLSKEASSDLINKTVIPSVTDPRSTSTPARLQPKAAELATQLIEKAKEKGIIIKVISGLRTIEDQNALYEQGRTKPGPIVTTARGGQSIHNTGLAFDIGVFRNDKFIGDDSDPAYTTVGEIGKSLGLEWGGDWKTIADRPHFQTKDALDVLHTMSSTIVSPEPTVSTNPSATPMESLQPSASPK